jgi:hypothetical protein
VTYAEYTISPETDHPLVMRIVCSHPNKRRDHHYEYFESLRTLFGQDLQLHYIDKENIEIIFVPDDYNLIVKTPAIMQNDGIDALDVELREFNGKNELELVRLFFSKQFELSYLDLNLYVNGAPLDLVRDVLIASAPNVQTIVLNEPIDLYQFIMVLITIPFSRLHDIYVVNNRYDRSSTSDFVTFTHKECDEIIEWLVRDAPQMTSFFQGSQLTNKYLIRQLKERRQHHHLTVVGTYGFD